MAHLLGSQFCIESLRTDVSDLQHVITSISSRIGPPLHCRSWKYPDKMAVEVGVTELLEAHVYFEGEDAIEDNQVAHIVLLELIIDRLLLFIHSIGRFIEHALAAGRAPSAASSEKVCTSVGLVAKKHWTKMGQLCTTLQQEQSETKSKKKKVKELESTIENLQYELSKYERSVAPVNLGDPSAINRAHPALGAASEHFGLLLPPATAGERRAEVARDCCHRSSQTVETAFVPCMSCGRVQDCLRSAGDAVAAACGTHGLPSHLAKFRRGSQLDSLDWWSANDIAHWSAEQNRDTLQLVRFAEERAATAARLREDLTAEVQARADAERNREESERSALTKVAAVEEAARLAKTKGEEQVMMVRLDVEAVKASRAEVERCLLDAQGELQRQARRCFELEGEKETLLAELEATRHEAMAAASSHAASLAAATAPLNDSVALLAELRTLNTNAGKRNESLQAKQDALVRRANELDQENAELHNDLADMESVRLKLEERVHQVEHENTTLTEQIRDKEALVGRIEREKQAREDNIERLRQSVATLEHQLTDMMERERLLIEYPDLNGPVNADLQGSGDVVTDMEKQIIANQARIALLMKQNTGLDNSVRKLRQCQGPIQELTKLKGVPTQLWKTASANADPIESNNGDDVIDVIAYQFDNSNTATALSKQTPAIGKHSAYSAKEVPTTATSKRHGGASSSSVGVYSKLKQAGLLKPGSRSDTSKAGAAIFDEAPYGSVICPGCNRMFSTPTDLRLHKPYCLSGGK